MNGPYLALTLAAYFILALVARTFCRWAARRIAQLDAADEQPQRIKDIETRAAIPAAPDNTKGIHRGDWDDCELILAATNEVEAGLDQLFKQLGPPREEEAQ